MSSKDIALSVRGVSKAYTIVHNVEKHDSLRDAVKGWLKAPRRRATKETFWALRDVSFDVQRGDVVGIIGRNGAGKSTLLKILSRITEPETGRIDLYGRVGSLLEVGTGFHPELTGRENIYLNGSIMGMRKREIDRHFDAIVDFAGVEKFLDTPVKRYSSGMYVRLAFAVAAHLEPEILVVDEVLAVGDAAFQKKCLGKMGDVAKEGRTVLFVSHNMAALSSMCTTAVMLDQGKLELQGGTQEVVQHYLRSAMSAGAIPLGQRQDRAGDGSVRMVSVKMETAEHEQAIRSSSCLKVTIQYKSEQPVRHPKFLLSINDYNNIGIYLLSTEVVGGLPDVLRPEGSVTCVTDPINLTPGRCFVNIALLQGEEMADYVQYAAEFDVEADDVYGSGKMPSREWVLCVLKHNWLFEGTK